MGSRRFLLQISALLLSTLCWSDTRMAAELEFDLWYFREGSSIRNYLDLPYKDSDFQRIDKGSVLPASTIFRIRDDISPETAELLSHFEFDWEKMFTPPKIEIRHKNPTDPEIVKKELSSLIRLFTKDETEYKKLMAHLSSIQAETPETKHLNIHLHSSDSENADRFEAYRRYQILTTLEFTHATDDKEKLSRLFISSSSAYSNNPWAKGISRQIGLSRFESRKRSIPINDEIDRLDQLETAQVEDLVKKYDLQIEGLANETLLNNLLALPLKPQHMVDRLEFFTDLYLHSPEDSSTRKNIVNTLTEPTPQKLNALVAHSSIRARFHIMSLLWSDPSISSANKAAIEKRIVLDFLELPISDKIFVLKFVTQNYSQERQKKLFNIPIIKNHILPAIAKEARDTLKSKSPQRPNSAADLLFITSDALDPEIQNSLERLREHYFKPENFHSVATAVQLPFFESPRAVINSLSDKHKKVFFDLMEKEKGGMGPDLPQLFDELKARFNIQYPTQRIPKNCRTAL